MKQLFNPDFSKKISEPGLLKEKEQKFSFDMIRTEYFNNVEKQLLMKIKKDRVGNEVKDRKLENVNNDHNETIAYIDKVCKPDEDKELPGCHNLWLVVDFDDVINQTTAYSEKYKEYFCEVTGLQPSEFDKLYEESKVPNNSNKKVFRFDKLIEKMKNLYPDKNDLIDKVMDKEELKPNKFIDQSVKRALMAIQDKDIKGYDNIRISILTFGDINYQKKRIDSTGIDQIVNDIIYTEGSKKEVLEKIFQNDYKNGPTGLTPFVITVDDSVEHVDDYENADIKRRFVNFHYRNPQAKRFNKSSESPLAITNIENEPGQAAMNIYYAAKASLQQNMQEDRVRLYAILKNPKEYKEKSMGPYSSTQSLEYNINYSQEADGFLVRECDYRLNYESESWPLNHSKIKIGEIIDGKISITSAYLNKDSYGELIMAAKSRV